MLYHLLYPLHTLFSALNVFRYITFRTAAATLTALFISFIVGPWLIRRLAVLRIGQQIREIGPAHAAKAGTPTMGGLLILLSLAISLSTSLSTSLSIVLAILLAISLSILLSLSLSPAL